MRLGELKELILARDYPERLVDSALEKAKSVTRHIALIRIIKNNKGQQKRPIFAIKYDPRLPSIANNQAKHWTSMAFMDQHMKEVFPQPPLRCFKKTKEPKILADKSKGSRA